MIEVHLTGVLKELTPLHQETEWIEFKCNSKDLEKIGEYISAIANSAALHHKARGYIIWGIEDSTCKIVGTAFKPRQTKKGNEELENWLGRLLFPSVDFRIHEFEYQNKPIVIFEIPLALHTPVRFRETEYIRVGSYKRKLKDFPEKERALWAIFAEQTFEKGITVRGLSSDQILSLIDYPSFFDLMDQSLPENRAGILERLTKENVILEKGEDRYDVTNLGAILFARELDEFDSLKRKAVRVVIYRDTSRVETVKEQPGKKGYAVGFQGLISYINDQLPRNEEVGQALRREVRMFPEIAVRELVANALIHQDFTITGTGPIVEIFTDRIEITNPGVPLIDTLRFIDEPPQSRNEVLASLLRRMNICEERGSGIDKVVFQAELFQLSPPDFQVTSNHTKAILYARKKLSQMDKNDRIRACYQHACLCWVSNKHMTNATLRKRFGIAAKNYAMASRIIAETIDLGLIKPYDPESTSRKYAKYVPFWA
jgi:predicted HTH transcriptional regulator